MEGAKEESTYGIDFLKITGQASDSTIMGETGILLEEGKRGPFMKL